MNNKKILRIFALIVAVLFSLIILSCAIFISVNNKPRGAFAVTSNNSVSTITDSVNVWDNYSSTYVFVSGTYLFPERFEINNLNAWNTHGKYLLSAYFTGWTEFTFYGGDSGSSDSLALYFTCNISDDGKSIIIVYSLFNDFIFDFFEEEVYSSSVGWTSASYRYITLCCNVPLSFKMFLDEFAVPSSEIYNNGYSDGYNSGYSNGLNKGQSDTLTNPVQFFISPVHGFLNTNLFGGFSLSMLFNIVLFVAVAIIFIKMFSGG